MKREKFSDTESEKLKIKLKWRYGASTSPLISVYEWKEILNCLFSYNTWLNHIIPDTQINNYYLMK